MSNITDWTGLEYKKTLKNRIEVLNPRMEDGTP